MIVLAMVAGANARDLHVDPATGDDKADGVAKPVKTIAQSIRLAQPGDTIHLAPATYYESAEFGKKSGEEGKPIVLDGHGAILEGSEPVLKKDWEQVGPGLYRKIHFIPNPTFTLQRWFMLWDGKMNHMGRTSKGHQDPLKKPDDLQVDEWTYVKEDDAFYLRIAPERDLDAANIRYPARSSGVALGGAAHIVVRDVTSTHVNNDGFNVHGSVRDARFEKICAIECGDDGFSAHEDAECEIDGLVSLGNSTGFTDILSSKTHYRNVHVEGCLGFGILFQGDGEHSVTNGVVLSASGTPLGMGGPGVKSGNPESCRLTLENVYFKHEGAPFKIRLPVQTVLKASRCTFVNFAPLESAGEFALADSVGADLAKLKELGLLPAP